MSKGPIIEKQNITDTLESNYMPYAMSVIVSRAIPEIDGFKPSHRKLLYTMYKMGLLNGGRTKSANVVGQTMKLNPHGDAAIYETMVRLTEGHMALLHPLVDSKGNFGRQYSRDMAFAASRYTEVKLSAVCSEVFKDIDKDTVSFEDNYDGTLKEPTLLPVSFPNILVNPNQGIAVGMASNICSFNLSEICDAAISVMKNPDADLTDILKAPDFSTGGDIIYNREEMAEIYKTGRGTFKIRAKYVYDKKSNCIDITEIPYTTTVEAIIEKIIELIKGGKLKEISDIRDETDLKGLKITIDLKKGTDPEKIMSRLYQMTTLQDSFGCNFNVLIEGSPMVLGVSEILSEWLRFRKSCFKRSLKYDIDKKSDKLHLLKGLELILLDIDEIQAEYVDEIKLRNLNKEYILKRTAEIKALEEEINELTDTLNDNKKIEKHIEKQLKEISKKFGVPRRSGIIEGDEITVIPAESFIEDYRSRLFRTKHNYLKKISLVSLRTSGEQRLKEDDEIVQEMEVSNKSDLLAFSSSGEVYKTKIHEIPDTKASQLGEYMPNLFSMSEGESILGIVVTDNYEGNLLFCFENGKMAKVSLKSYETKLNRKKLTNAFSLSSPLVKLIYLSEDTELIATTSVGKVLVFNSESIALKSTKSTQGVYVVSPKKGSVVSDVQFVSEAGIQNLSHYRTKNIPAKGTFPRDEDKITSQQISLFEEDSNSE